MKFRCKCFSKDFCVIYSLVYFCWFVNLLVIQKEKKLKTKKKKKKFKKHRLTCFASCTGCEGFDCTNTKDHIMYDSFDDNDNEIGRNIHDVFM